MAGVLLREPIFQVDEQRFFWEDVILHADLTDRWPPFERRIREGLACLGELRESGGPKLEALVEEAAAEFRYQRMLISADETEAWLAARGLAPSDWIGWVTREVLRREWVPRLEALMARHPAARPDVAACVAVDLQCSADGRALAWHLAETAASMEAAGETTTAVAGSPPEEIDGTRMALPGIDPDRAARRVGPLARLIAAHRQLQERAVAPEAIRREIERSKLDWIRVECRIADFESEARAREALLCILEDGLPLERVAADARVPVQEGRYYLDEVDPEIRPRLLGGAPGDVIGPIPLDAGYRLVLLANKQLPSDADPEVVHLATVRARARALADRVARRIRWVDQSLAPR